MGCLRVSKIKVRSLTKFYKTAKSCPISKFVSKQPIDEDLRMNQITFPNTLKPWSTGKTNLERILQDSCKINISCKSLVDQIKSCKMLAGFLEEIKSFPKELATKNCPCRNLAKNMLALKFQFIGLRVE